jgi:hypothetical protein
MRISKEHHGAVFDFELTAPLKLNVFDWLYFAQPVFNPPAVPGM